MPSQPSQDQWTQVLRAGDLDRFQALLDAGADPNTPLEYTRGLPPLCWVLQQIRDMESQATWEPWLRALLAAGAHAVPPGPKLVPWDRHPLAMVATSQSRLPAFEAVWRLLPADRARLDKPMLLPKSTPALEKFGAVGLLELCLIEGNLPVARRLLEGGACAPTAVGPCPWMVARGLKPLLRPGVLASIAACAGQPRMEDLLVVWLDAGAWPQADRDLALRMAVKARASLATIDRLLAAGAVPSDTHPLDPDPLPLLAQAVAPTLREGRRRGARFAPVSRQGVVARLAAATGARDALLDFSLVRGFEEGQVELANSGHAWRLPKYSYHSQLLGLAAHQGQARAVAELLAAGADPHHRDARGRTPLHLAALEEPERAQADDERMPSPIDQLLDAGADPAAVDARGRAPLEYWIAHRDPILLASWAVACATRLMEQTLARRPDLAPRLEKLLAKRAFSPEDPVAQAWTGFLAKWRSARRLDQALPASPTLSRSRL